ncbi:MAG: transporter related [Steroidobacteraceae bacterium]|jgi:putative ABC transport system ATP-binding protein|nr:transporter related [Steroidobacteraceae bacterium]
MLKVEGISKTYRTSEVETRAIHDISFEIRKGEFVAIMGPSGCGKSTLLNILGLLDQADSGNYWLDGANLTGMSEKELTNLRRRSMGFIFQNFNLIDDLTVEANVEVGLMYRGVGTARRRKLVKDALEKVGLSHRARHLPKQLSGGQQQRVAVTRALVSEPQLVLADEPTGNLDTANGEAIMGLLGGLVEAGTTVIMVTHSQAHAAAANRTFYMLDGRLVSDTLLAA